MGVMSNLDLQKRSVTVLYYPLTPGETIRIEYDESTDGDVGQLNKELVVDFNRRYDAFLDKYGFVHVKVDGRDKIAAYAFSDEQESIVSLKELQTLTGTQRKVQMVRAAAANAVRYLTAA